MKEHFKLENYEYVGPKEFGRCIPLPSNLRPIPPEYQQGKDHDLENICRYIQEKRAFDQRPVRERELRFQTNPNWFSTFLKPSEIVVHNSPDDCWVSLNGVVKDLTPLLKEHANSDLIKPILANAGKDISCWFKKNGHLRTCIHPVTGIKTPYLPHGLLPHVNTINLPHVGWEAPEMNPWWKDVDYNMGLLTSNVRPIRILNVSNRLEVTLEVCEEDTINQIRDRYLMFNSNADSYVWKFQGRAVDMEKTLTENNILDARKKLRSVDLPDDIYTPCLMLYYKDDFRFVLTENSE